MLELFTAENALALLTLTALEVVLGIDNLVVISILTGKLPPEQPGPRAAHRAARGDGDAHRAAADALLDHGPDRGRSSASRASTSRAAT